MSEEMNVTEPIIDGEGTISVANPDTLEKVDINDIFNSIDVPHVAPRQENKGIMDINNDFVKTVFGGDNKEALVQNNSNNNMYFRNYPSIADNGGTTKTFDKAKRMGDILTYNEMMLVRKPVETLANKDEVREYLNAIRKLIQNGLYD